MNNSGWSSSWQDFLNVDKATFISALEKFYQSLPWTDTLSSSQKQAWEIEYDVMKASLQAVCSVHSFAKTQCWIAFEQELIGEGGKRAADVNLVLPSGELFVIEFKHKTSVNSLEIVRANFDLQTMLHFHSESVKLKGYGFLVLTKNNATPFRHSNILCDIADNNQLPLLIQYLNKSLMKPICYDVTRWQHGEFYRQPSILHGTVQVFFEQKIPTLKTAAGDNILAARQALVELYTQAKAQQKRYVIVVNGRPGAGKTLLGISVVSDLVNQFGADTCKPLFLSGNKPLVQVLRYTLDFHGWRKNRAIQSKVLIENLIDFKRSLTHRTSARDEHFIIFDEAQRAWERVGTKDSNSSSELRLLCDWLVEKPFGVLVLLVGDGQAIHNNEMSSPQMFQQLDDTLFHYRDRLIPILPDQSGQYLKKSAFTVCETFNLKTPIRQAYTDKLDQWIEAVLSADHLNAKSIAEQIKGVYPLWITTSKSAAETYAHHLQMELCQQNIKQDAFRSGWIKSSKGGSVMPETQNESNQIGAWYVDPPQSKNSCCQFRTACTEFSSQGLELSLALLYWGKDLLFRDENWNLSSIPQYKRKKDHYTFGCYRVLLSRGRNGLVILCEDQETYAFLHACGMDILPQ